MKVNIEDFGMKIGKFKKGKNNSITDIDGVKVGHITYDDGERKTGITAILPHDGNIFKEKLIGATHIINGFGKTIGTVQIEELGTIETPILLTNTLSVGKVSDGLIKYMLKDNSDIGVDTGTINPVIGECNDGYLNKIQDIFLTEEDVLEAIENADDVFKEGSVGAGTGMVCYGLKGGIGSSSRIIEIAGREYTVGILVLTNFGRLDDLLFAGKNIGKDIKSEIDNYKEKEDKGSIIIILGTDIPLSYRQLQRVIKRVYPGISRTGSYTSNGSGEIAIGFSTANRIQHYEDNSIIDLKVIHENKINDIFMATVEATEEAILSSLINAETKIGRNNHKIYSIREFDNILKNK